MRNGVFMMAALLTFSGVSYGATQLEAKVSRSGASQSYEDKWCRDAGFVLRNSLEAAYRASTFEEEISILKRAINSTLASLNPKFSYYLESTLLLGLKLEAVVATSKDKTLVLRRNIEHALDDLHYLDSRFNSRYNQDHTSYVRKVLNRVSDEAYRAKTDSLENMILNAGARSAVEILSESENRRDPKNACAARYLKEVLQLNEVISKRSLISEAVRTLGYGCRY